MLKIYNLPSYTKTTKVNYSSKDRMLANSFIKRKKWIVDILINQFNLKNKLYESEVKEIYANCIIELWQAYLKPSDNQDNYCFVAVRRCIIRDLNSKGHKKLQQSKMEMINIDTVANQSHINVHEEVENKIFIERLEKKLSNESKKMLMLSLFYLDGIKKSRFREFTKKMGYSTIKMNRVKKEIKEAMYSSNNFKYSTGLNTELINQETYQC